MKYLNILNTTYAVAVVFACFTSLLDPSCLAVAINDEGLPSPVSLPFNDLLPPLSNADFENEKTMSFIVAASTTSKATDISATTTIASGIPAPPMKPTKLLKTEQSKKLQHQQQKIKQQTPLEVPVLDLYPEVAPALQAPEAKTVASVTVSVLKPSAIAQHQTLSAETAQTKYQATTATTTNYQAFAQQQLKPQNQLKQQQKQQLVKQLGQQTVVQQKLQPQNVATINKAALASVQISQERGRVNVELLQQLLHSTTRRPSRGALPTLTPFPRRIK
ncbi:nuclear transcription factor Y subunit beta-like [Eurosta solidaginis]|uniref:nuclear transcription factor Y subunit beta-like n=1 Tax=Eurosta solidaginis TaxID=178769 RepID=UPI0035309053